MRLEAGDYRRAAMERLADAQRLLDAGRWVGAAYLAGRASESFLRALLRLQETSNESGHDLRSLLRFASRLGILQPKDESSLFAPINEIAAIWHNNLRFADTTAFLRHLKQQRKDRNIKGDAVEFWAKRLNEHAEAIVNRAEVIWNRSKRN